MRTRWSASPPPPACRRLATRRALITALLLAAAAGCDRRAEPPPLADSAGRAPAAAQADPEMLRRHASAADQMVAEMRQHVNFMWRLPPRDVPAHAEEHDSRVEGLIGMLEEQIREMDREMGMEAEQMGELLGIRADQYGVLQEEMRIARAEAMELRTATETQIRERIRGHLDRLDRILDTIESSAAHRHRVAGGGAPAR